MMFRGLGQRVALSASMVVLLAACEGSAPTATGDASSGRPTSAPPELARWTVVRDVVALSDPDGQLEIRATEPWGTHGFVAVGAGPRGAAAWYSADGEAWSRVPDGAALRTPGSATMFDLAAAGDSLIAVGIGDSATIAAVWTSMDGQTWERTYELSADEYAGGMVGVASSTEVAVAVGIALPDPNVEAWIGTAWTSSPVGVDWTPVADIAAPFPLFDVEAGGPGFVAVGGSGGPVALSSSDGERWTAADLTALDAGTEWRALAVGRDGRMVAVGSVAGSFLASPDGLRWERLTCGDATLGPVFTAVSAGPSGFVAAGSDSVGPVLWRSDDGVAWESVSELAFAVGTSFTAVALGASRAVVAGRDVDGSAFVWVGPADGRGDHPVEAVTCESVQL